MKQITIIGLFAFFTLTFLSDNAIAKERKNEKKVVLSVNMDCHACVEKIEGNIPYEKGVKDLNVSLENKTCEVTYRVDKTSPGALIKAFKKIGYNAEVKKSENEYPVVKPDTSHNGHIHE